jgi:hypothetical protein
MAVTGGSHGGVQTLLAAEAGTKARAYVPFAPAAMGWDGNPELQARLVRAVKGAKEPIFLLQAENDYSLGPSQALGPELERKGPPNRARVYPPFGESPRLGHAGFGVLGAEVWGADVCAFLEEVMPRSAAPA